MEGEFVESEQPLPQPNYGVPSPPNLETVKHYTTLSPFTLEDKDDPESVILGELPAYMQTYFWAYLSKDFVLTYIRDSRDVELVKNKLEASIEAFEMSLAPGRFSWDTIRDLDNLRTVVFMRVLRSLNGFERKQENSFSNEYTHKQFVGSVDQQRPGFIQRVGNTIFGGMR